MSFSKGKLCTCLDYVFNNGNIDFTKGTPTLFLGNGSSWQPFCIEKELSQDASSSLVSLCARLSRTEDPPFSWKRKIHVGVEGRVSSWVAS